MGIPEENLHLLNKTTAERDWHYLPKELGGGVQAMFEGFHYIHCLVCLTTLAIILYPCTY
jgi:hypothetical protein